MRETDEIRKALDKARAEGRLEEGVGVNLPVAGSDNCPAVKPLSEKEFMWKVIGLAEENGWRVYHVFFSQCSDPGYPDLTMCHSGRRRVLFAELKTEKTSPTMAQLTWLEELRASGAEVHLWRPHDLPAIERILKGE